MTARPAGIKKPSTSISLPAAVRGRYKDAGERAAGIILGKSQGLTRHPDTSNHRARAVGKKKSIIVAHPPRT